MIIKPRVVNREGEEVELILGVGVHPYRPFGEQWNYSSAVFFLCRWHQADTGSDVVLDPSTDFPAAKCFSFYPSPDGRFMAVIAFSSRSCSDNAAIYDSTGRFVKRLMVPDRSRCECFIQFRWLSEAYSDGKNMRSDVDLLNGCFTESFEFDVDQLEFKTPAISSRRS